MSLREVIPKIIPEIRKTERILFDCVTASKLVARNNEGNLSLKDRFKIRRIVDGVKPCAMSAFLSIYTSRMVTPNQGETMDSLRERAEKELEKFEKITAKRFPQGIKMQALDLFQTIKADQIASSISTTKHSLNYILLNHCGPKEK